jgi:energy-coupling factor transport system ATP-binding protein
VSRLVVSRVSFSYGDVPAIREVSFVVAPGESVALLGHNGAGKTTLTKLIMGLLHPDSGEILLAGVPNMGQPPEQIARDAAYVFQHSDQQLFARTVLEEVSFGPKQLGRSSVHAEDLAHDALLDVGLEAHGATHPYDLPSAERKLVALAAALAQRPRLLILDEPTQGLDAVFRDRVYRVLQGVTSRGVAVLSVTHDLAFVAEAADRALVLKQGALVADTPARDLVTDERRATDLNLALPPASRLALALGLPGKPVRRSEVAERIRERQSAER